MDSRSLILIGCGGHCKSVINTAESIGKPIAGILDLPTNVGQYILNYQVIGTDDCIEQLVANHTFIVSVGFVQDVSVRMKLHEKVLNAHGILDVLIASDASTHDSSSIGQGTVVLHRASVNAGVKVGLGCIINTAANLEHDVEVDDYSHVSTGVMINGDCKIGKRCFIGSGSVIANGVRICDDVIIGAGSLVIHDITLPGIYVGSPVQPINR
ncbi:MAG: NeuD/PglB/VioB family sugar acetyltransferase [Prevotellaceae bacterium]|nr:NeuD/PglB/VioB family sugar acetyltransferase [Prevotellaceae bacterium]MDY3365226.1 NeuD/PglB/VioB family sugar acetyltransferase [Prevotella sp.]